MSSNGHHPLHIVKPISNHISNQCRVLENNDKLPVGQLIGFVGRCWVGADYSPLLMEYHGVVRAPRAGGPGGRGPGGRWAGGGGW